MNHTETVKILIVGDTVGKPGRKACLNIVPRLREKLELDFVIINGENIAGGSSITEETARDLMQSGANVITSGDHIFRKKEGIKIVADHPYILRPLNYPEGTPGNGVM